MTAPQDRRGFLRGLAALPLIGGSVAIIGQPTAVADVPSLRLLVAYGDWLHYERKILMDELTGYQPELARKLEYFVGNGSADFHFPMGMDYRDAPQPSTRAALVLSTVGWQPRQGGAHV